MIARLILMLTLLAAAPVQALQFDRCDKAQIAFASAAVAGAAEAIRAAGAAVGDNDDYARWFGAYTSANAEVVRAGLKAVARVLNGDDLTIVCPPIGRDGCDLETYAYVFSDQPFAVNVCSSFFEQPTLAGIVPTSSAFESGTREGTIIHEVSHFDVVAGTEDYCYGRTDCMDMAKEDPARAIDNADTFQYFTEDVVLGREGRLSSAP